MGEPARMADHEVGGVAMQHEIAPAIGSFVERRLLHLDAAEMRAVIIPQELVVIAGQVDDARPLRALRRSFWTTSLCVCGQYQPPFSASRR